MTLYLSENDAQLLWGLLESMVMETADEPSRKHAAKIRDRIVKAGRWVSPAERNAR